jgi:citrate synthase
VLRQNLQLVSMLPMLSIYAYQAQNYYLNKQGSLLIYDTDPEISTAENILQCSATTGNTPKPRRTFSISR